MRLSDIRQLVRDIRRAGDDASHSAWVALNPALYAFLGEVACCGKEAALAWLEKQAGYLPFKCAYCVYYQDSSETHETQDGVVCNHCRGCDYSRCSDCDELAHDDSGGYTVSGLWVCDGCLQAYRCCDGCDERYHRDDLEHGHCGNCASENDDSDANGILGYESNVLEHCKGKWLSAPKEKTDKHGNGYSKRPTLWMGWELEVMPRRGRSEASEAVETALHGRGILKNDGSLDDGGFEIVSLPATLAYHQSGWDDGFLDAIVKHCRGWNQETCGMHVHIARDALMPLQIGRLMVFINGDGKGVNNRKFIEKVAGRSAGEYCRVWNKDLTAAKPYIEKHDIYSSAKRNCDCASCVQLREAEKKAREAQAREGIAKDIARIRKENGSLARACKDRSNSDRYQAINLNNDATIEIRIFQSNVARLGFLKNIEFCHAAVTFCALAGNTELTSENFLRWLDGERGSYPSLYRWAVRERFIATRHTSAQGVAAPAIAA